MNINPACEWPNCGCDTAGGDPCRFEDPVFYERRAADKARQSNMTTGFPGYRQRIEAITDALGGDKYIRAVIGKTFESVLKLTVARQFGGETYSIPGYDPFPWATDRDLDDASAWAERVLTMKTEEKLTATAPFKGVRLEVYETEAYLRGGDYGIKVAYYTRDSYAQARSHKPAERYNVVLTDDGADAIKADRNYRSLAMNKSANASKPATAHTSMRRMVEQAFDVKLTDVE